MKYRVLLLFVLLMLLLSIHPPLEQEQEQEKEERTVRRWYFHSPLDHYAILCQSHTMRRVPIIRPPADLARATATPQPCAASPVS